MWKSGAGFSAAKAQKAGSGLVLRSRIEMLGDELGHSEASDLVPTEDARHLLIGREVLLVFRVLQVVLLDVGPQVLDDFAAAGLLATDDGGEFGGQVIGFGQTFAFRHGE